MRLNSSAAAVLSAGTKNLVKTSLNTSSSVVQIAIVKSLANNSLNKSSSPAIQTTSAKNLASTSLNIGISATQNMTSTSLSSRISAVQNPSVKNLVKTSFQSRLNTNDVESKSGKLALHLSDFMFEFKVDQGLIS